MQQEVTLLQIFRDLRNTTKRLEKEKIIKEALLDEQVAEYVYFIFYYAYAYDLIFNIKKVPEWKPIRGTFIGGLTFHDAFERLKGLLQAMSNRQFTGHDARDRLQDTSGHFSKEVWDEILTLMIIKDMKCGVTITTFNKVALQTHHAPIPRFQCQLAKVYEKNAEPDTQYIAEPKLDGIRVLITATPTGSNIYTRNGKLIENYPMHCLAIQQYAKENKVSFVLDGEVMSDSFQKLMTQVRRKNNVNTTGDHIHIFDCVDHEDFLDGKSSQALLERKIQAKKIVGDVNRPDLFKFVEHHDLGFGESKTFTEKSNELFKQWVAEGYEGMMIKDLLSPYESKRTKHWLKIKPSLEVDLDIVDFQPGTGKNVGRLGALILSGFHEGKHIETNVGTGFSEAQREEIWNDRQRLVGQTVTIFCDAITTALNSESYSVRFPSFKCIRNDR